ncbi:methyltransferase, FxLD system [Streptomyces sp. Ncost-T10-10d]|uniref:methyltransferase, FxLD system n=1 Tax=Streptomyces sp. Ncost-T10-10d TaxID=1839774 RepID=UPI00081F4BCE|nr:methyltransferase, FxLD system [Streptomyces sp. Ncost-T10-10d]SCF95670.1 protein-L-isoaspartate(D-aspartate) O-methyltransferase [Streptomyces sp. Ncost-T10-10d]
MGYVLPQEWDTHYKDGKGFRWLGDAERAVLSEHVPAPDGGRALDVGCGTGGLVAFLAGIGYQVDGIDYADNALIRARAEHAGAEQVRWLRLDIEQDDLDALNKGYDLITLRLAYAFLRDRTRVLHMLGERLRAGGTLVIITPTTAHTPPERRDVALDEHEISLLTAGWKEAERLEADELAVLILRGPCHTDTRAVEKRAGKGHAYTAALTVVTDAAGRVLLGRSTRRMWELPGGKTSGSENFAAAAVRELAEETGLIAAEVDAHVLTMLVDDSHGVPRLTAVVRVTAWSGTLTNREEALFARWEWLDLHALAHIGDVFAPAAQALDAVWPGVIPGLPSIHAYPHAVDHPAAAGEPAEAVRLRHQMADAVIAGGWAPSAPVQEALRTVPRHRFTPETDLTTAYADNLAVVTRRDDTGQAISSVSAAWLQADMVEGLRLRPGASVYEAGSGGYNAELIAHVVGPGGRVVTVDIDPYVVHRTRRFTAEAGSGRVTALHGDGSLGAPLRHVPRGGFDASVITHNVWDIAHAWREQLTEGGHLVVPLDIHGYTRSITFQRQGDVLRARGFTHCGFVRDQGKHARNTPIVDLLDGQLQIRFEDGRPVATEGLEEALCGPRHEVATGVTVGSGVYFGSLQLFAATTLPSFCRLAVDRGKDTGITQIAKGADAPAILGEASLAYLTHVQTRHGDNPADRLWEFTVHAFGDQGPVLASQVAATVRAWDRDVRNGDGPALTVHPAGTPDHRLPAGDVVDKRHARLVFQWPGRDAVLPAPVERMGAVPPGLEGT